MDFKQAIQSGLDNYVNFQGRAARSEYWYWILFVLLVSLAASMLDGALFPGVGDPGKGPLSIIISLAFLLPGLAVSVRRLHDLERSGWWLLIALIPIIGGLVLIYWGCKKGTDGDNEYGPDPLSFYTPSQE